MTQTDLPTSATEELGSEFSPYQPWVGLDSATGLMGDSWAQFDARGLEEMLDSDGRARAVEQVLTLPLRAAPLTVKPAHGDTGEADDVNRWLGAMTVPTETVLGQGAQSLVYRATFHEAVYAQADGEWVYDRLAWRPPDSCSILRDKGTGRLRGFSQQVAGQPLPVPIINDAPTDAGLAKAPKAVVWLHGENRDPVRGVSEMAVAYRCWRDKQKVRALWFMFLEGASVGRIVAHVNSDSDAAPVAKTLAGLKNAGVAAVANVDRIDQIDVSGEGGRQFTEALRFLDGEIAGSVLAGFLGLGDAAAAGRGSFALSKDQTDFFTSAMDANARELAAVVRGFTVPLLRLNRGPQVVVPQVTLGPISGADVTQTINLLQSLAGATQPVVPAEFVDELTLRVAGALDLDVDKVAAAIKTRTEQAAEAAPGAAASAPVSAAVGVGLDAMTAAKAGRNPLEAVA